MKLHEAGKRFIQADQAWRHLIKSDGYVRRLAETTHGAPNSYLRAAWEARESAYKDFEKEVEKAPREEPAQ